MKSHYGNVIVDFFELLFSLVALVLTWFSLIKDGMAMFAITAILYMLPRFLLVSKDIMENGSDVFRAVVNMISLGALLLAFLAGGIIVFNYAIDYRFFDLSVQKVIQIVFYCVSAISLFDYAFKCIAGISQRFAVTKNCFRR